jgi:hypothetical protein
MAQGLGAEVRTSRPATWTQCRQRGGAVIRGSLVMLDIAGSDALTADWDGVSASKLGTQAAASGPLGTVLEATEGLTIGRVGVLMSPTVKDDGLGEYELGEVGGGLVAPVVVESALVLVDATSVAGAAVQVGASAGTACFAVGAGATYGILLTDCTTDDGKGPTAALNYRPVLLHSQGVGSANATLAAGSVGTTEIADRAVTPAKTALLTFNAQIGTDYTLAASDEGVIVTLSNAAAIDLEVPLNATVAIPVGFECVIAQGDAGTVTVVPEVGVTINSAGGLLDLEAQYASATLIKTATNAWLLVGALA